MRPTKTVKLSKPIADAGGRIMHELVFETPSAATYFRLGPLATVYSRDGIVTSTDLAGVVEQYAAACVRNVDPGLLPGLFGDAPLADALAVRAAFGDFFGEAFAAVAGEAVETAMAGASAETA